MNLLDLDNDVLNIIGSYVKRHNQVEEIFQRADRWVNYLIKKNRFDKTCMRDLYWRKLFECSDDEVDEYMKTRDLERFYNE
jgi:hypothetical protein